MTTDSVYPNKHGTDITTQYTVNVYVQNLVKCSQNITFTDHSLTLWWLYTRTKHIQLLTKKLCELIQVY